MTDRMDTEALRALVGQATQGPWFSTVWPDLSLEICTDDDVPATERGYM